MAEPVFRDAQDSGRFAEHVRPVNELVDDLRRTSGRGWVPYVAPVHGGARARLLFILGPRA
jgi:hypothetical protein